MKYEIEEHIIKRHTECLWTCQKEGCYKPSMQIAHRISKGKAGRQFIRLYIQRVYGYDLKERQIDKIIHHRLNTFPVCSSACNDSFNLHISQSEKVEFLVSEIFNELIQRGEL